MAIRHLKRSRAAWERCPTLCYTKPHSWTWQCKSQRASNSLADRSIRASRIRSSINTDIFCVVLSMAMRIPEPLVLAADLGLASVCPMVKVESEHTLVPSFQRMLALSQSALVSGWLEVPAHTFAELFQRMPALSQSALVRGWLSMSAANVVEDRDVAAVEFDSAHTLASSLQCILALSHSNLVSGWLGVSAAIVTEPTSNPVAQRKDRTNAFITPAAQCFEPPERDTSPVYKQLSL